MASETERDAEDRELARQASLAYMRASQAGEDQWLAVARAMRAWLATPAPAAGTTLRDAAEKALRVWDHHAEDPEERAAIRELRAVLSRNDGAAQ